MNYLACSRRSDSGARAKNKALSLAIFFVRAPLSERLEQAMNFSEKRHLFYILSCFELPRVQNTQHGF